MPEIDPFTAFTQALSHADDALEAGTSGQGHLERLVSAGWKLADHIDAGAVADICRVLKPEADDR